MTRYSTSALDREMMFWRSEGKECMGGGIVELMTIVTLDDFDGVAKLHGNKGEFF
jgi:hypothetical protein